jgi:4-amino-4-deoxy-L-arabinose transferase-like glycosyltransferase
LKKSFDGPAFSLRERLYLLLLWVVVTAYNLFKPFHIDDTAYVVITHWISSHPLHPMRGMLNWSGTSLPIHETLHPHLYFYLLAGWGRLFGFSEPSLHVVQSMAALACIVLFYRLAKTLIPASALWATTIVVLGPAFIVEQNLMIDVPVLASWLLFFNPLILDVETEHQNRRYVIAALACSAGILIKYSSVVLLATLCLSLVYERRWKQAWTLLCPIATVIAWSLFNYFDYGGIHLLNRPPNTVHHLGGTLRLAFDWVIGLGALTPMGIIVVLDSRPKWARWRGHLFAGIGILFALFVAAVGLGILKDHLSDILLAIAFAISGCLICLPLLRITYRFPWSAVWRTDSARRAAPVFYLIVWIGLTSFFYLKAAPFIAVRHILLILPAVTLLLLMIYGASLTSASRRFGLIMTLVISAGLCVSDWRFATYYRSEAAQLAQSLPKDAPIWATGQLGWQWYAKQQGFQEVDVLSSVIHPGDIYIEPIEVDHSRPHVPTTLQLFRTDVQPNPLVNLLCTGRPARFYRSSLTPWSVSRNCTNHINVYRVETVGATAKGPDLGP